MNARIEASQKKHAEIKESGLYDIKVSELEQKQSKTKTAKDTIKLAAQMVRNNREEPTVKQFKEQ